MVGTDTLDGKFEFQAPLVSILSECRAWDTSMLGEVFQTPKFEFHIFTAQNASYWKTDGQRYTVHLLIYDKKTKKAFMQSCLCAYSKKEVKKNYKYLCERVIKLNKDPEAIIQKMEEHIKDYPWQSAFTHKNGEGQLYS
jgi:hypothetical protein